MSDISAIIIWWATISVIGVICYPVTALLFSRFADRGYIFSKIVGILITSYIVWLLGSAHILPFQKISILVVLLAVTLANILVLSRARKNNQPITFPWKLIIFEEILFFAGLAFWSFVRGNEPSIHGLEKFMDFGFVNSILRSNYFPPTDMWLTKSPDYAPGYFINYYYYGHYVAAFLTKLSGIDSAVTYNLMIATLFAFTFTLAFCLGLNLYHLFRSTPDNSKGNRSWSFKAVVVGLLAAFIVSFGGNLHPVYVLTGGYPNDNPQPPWNLQFGYHPERYWYPNATRFIPFTIHEFPIYSFVVADLHGHVSDIPFVFLTLAILLSLITDQRDPKNLTEPSGKKSSRSYASFLHDFTEHTNIPLPVLIFLGGLLAVMYMTNAWDGLIYMILSGLVFLYINLREQFKAPGGKLASAIYKTFSSSLFLLFFFLITNLPFQLNFRPFVSGVGVLCAPASLLGKKIGPFLFEVGKCQKSPLYMLAILWGFFYFNLIGFFIFTVIPALKSGLIKGAKNANNAADKYTGKIARLILALHPVDMFIVITGLISTLLLIFPEFFYMKDIYPAHYRANTMFKLGYQAFMMLGLASGYIVFRIKEKTGGKTSFAKVIYQSLFILLFAFVAIYPYFAINSYYGGLKNYQGLYGLNWLAGQYPDDYKAIIWLRTNINCEGVSSGCDNQPVIVEANGDSYTDYLRVSANTGLPTIIGWPVHEWLWRGSYDEAGRRIPEVASIYESTDLALTRSLLQKYNAGYVFVGTLEREKYKNLDEGKFSELGTVVFQSGNTRIFKLNQSL